MNNSKRKSFLYSISSALISVLFLLTSCTGLINNSSDSDGVTISGNLSFGTERAVFRTAYAKPVTEGLTWKVTAKNEDSEIEGTVSEMNFTLTLPSAGEWTITATGRNTAGMSFAGSKKITIEDSDIDDITVSVTQKTSGKGNVNLKIVDKTDTIKSFSYEVEDASPEVKDSVAFTGDTAYFKLNDISAGAYLVNFKFFNAAGKEVYSATDAINVFDSCTTDIWVFNGEEAAAWEITHVNSVIPVQTANGTFDFSSLGNDVNIVLDTNASSDDFYLNDYKMVFKALDSHGEQITEGLTWSAKLLYGGNEVPATYYTIGSTTGVFTARQESSGFNKALAVSGPYQVFVKAVRNGKNYSSTFDFNIPDAYYYECETDADGICSTLEDELDSFNSMVNKIVIKVTGSGRNTDSNDEGTIKSLVSSLNCVSAYLDFSEVTGVNLVTNGEFLNKETMIVSIQLPSALNVIESQAFKNCTRLTSIEIPDFVHTIGAKAFLNCKSLKGIELSDSLGGVDGTVGSEIFQSCIRLESISLPAGVTEIPESMFKACYSLSEINYEGAITSIGKDAFAGCYSLTEFTLPDDVTSIPESAFQGCSSLTEINLDNVTQIGESAFYGCTSLSDINLSNVTSIGKSAFYDCKSLNTVTLSDELTSIAEGLFKQSGITEIEIPASVTRIDKYAFSESNLSILTFADGSLLKAIGNEAFKKTNLTSLTVPDNLKVIGSYAFYGNTNLESVTFGSGSIIKAIGNYAFYDTKLDGANFSVTGLTESWIEFSTSWSSENPNNFDEIYTTLLTNESLSTMPTDTNPVDESDIVNYNFAESENCLYKTGA